ncbi:MAG TPA: DUF1566 domain-containing protein [Nevskia sp.]|nr:DUF1566 domain-containing protein [Nevskia sp.]
MSNILNSGLGVELIARARRHQLQAETPRPTAEQIFSEAGALVAKGLDLLQQAQDRVEWVPAPIDPCEPPQIVFVGADGNPRKEKDGAVAFVLPQYRRMFTAGVQTAKNWDAAVALGPACTLLGFNDWKLAAVKELELLVSRERTEPATYPALVSHTPYNDWYWTRDPHPSDSSYAFSVGLSGGHVGWYCRYRSGLVRLCREVSPRQCLEFGRASS